VAGDTRGAHAANRPIDARDIRRVEGAWSASEAVPPRRFGEADV
jgi:hypothetical protein